MLPPAGGGGRLKGCKRQGEGNERGEEEEGQGGAEGGDFRQEKKLGYVCSGYGGECAGHSARRAARATSARRPGCHKDQSSIPACTMQANRSKQIIQSYRWGALAPLLGVGASARPSQARRLPAAGGKRRRIRWKVTMKKYGQRGAKRRGNVRKGAGGERGGQPGGCTPAAPAQKRGQDIMGGALTAAACFQAPSPSLRATWRRTLSMKRSHCSSVRSRNTARADMEGPPAARASTSGG